MDAQAALDYLTKTYQRSDVIDPRKVISITIKHSYVILEREIFIHLTSTFKENIYIYFLF